MRSLLAGLLTFGLLSVSLAPRARAAEERIPGELGLLFGITRLDRDVVGPRRDPDYSPVFGLRLGANMQRPVSNFLEALYGRFDSDFGDKTDVFEGRVGLERNFAMGSPRCSWYLAGALGWVDADLPAGGGDFGRPLVSAGIGIRHAAGIWSRWHLELREEWWVGDEGLAGKDVANTQLLLGWAAGLKDTRAPLFESGSRTLILEGVTFITDSAELTAESRTRLNRTAASLRQWPNVRVEIGGHTDSVADDAYNMELSQRRAESVRSYLIQKGIHASRLTAKGYGETHPIAPNDTESGRARNRRVELTRVD